MNLGDQGEPAEITADNVIELIAKLGAILEESSERPCWIRIPQPSDGKARRHSLLDKRQLRRFRRAKGRKRGFHVSGYLTGNVE